MNLARKLKKWTENQLISEAQASAILSFEKEKSRTHAHFGLGGVGIFSILLGIISLIASNWEGLSPETKIISHILLNFSVAAAFWKWGQKNSWVRESLIAIQAGLIMTFIALIGQILQTQAPLWQGLGAWLVLATPMLLLYARFFGVIVSWFVILGLFAFSFADHVLSKAMAEAFLSGLPFLLYAFFALKAVRGVLSNWSHAAMRVFWVFIVGFVSLLYLFAPHLDHEVYPVSLFVVGSGCLLNVLLNVLQRIKLLSWWQNVPVDADALLLVSYALSVIIMFSPALNSFACAAIFCAYWFFVGAIGLRQGLEKVWSSAMLLVGFRLFLLYADVMGSLAMEGLGLIVTGGLFLAFAWGMKKMMAYRPAWLVPAKKEDSV